MIEEKQDDEKTLQQENISRSWAERNGFADWVVALLWLFLCMTVFQIVAMLLAGGGYILTQYVIDYQGLMQLINGLKNGDTKLLTSNVNLLFIANSTWQILFLGFGTYSFVRICSGKNRRYLYLRLRQNSSLLIYMGIAALLITAVQPVIWFIGWLNAFIPVPEMFRNLQQSQMDLISNFLKHNNNVAFALFNVALVPAICEEILFRGFVFRSFEKKWGIKTSVVLSGLLFGLYHIQLSNLFPLAIIGMLLAFIAWQANSIYPAMLAHFINNGASVLVAVYYPNSSIAESSVTTMPPIWMVIVSGAISAYLLSLLINHQITSRGISYD